MRILYGVVGEGMGHAMRSRVVLEHLTASGHAVEIVASGRARDYLAARFRDVHGIAGFHLVTEENRVRLGKTLWSNVLEGVRGLPRNIATYFELIDRAPPDVVISDFESWSYLYARRRRLPVISIDNMQLINRCEHPPDVLAGHRLDFEVARAFVKGKLPYCRHYLITTFVRPRVRKERTSLHPPILRPEILAARPTNGEHLLVYQTKAGNDALAAALARLGLECRVYGMRRDAAVEGNVHFRPFDEHTFIEDLAAARGVVASAGFTLMSEAIYLRKPMLAVPLAGQFEQALNAAYLARAGYGRAAARVDDPAVLREFVDAIPACAGRLADYEQDGNADLLGALDRLLATI